LLCAAAISVYILIFTINLRLLTTNVFVFREQVRLGVAAKTGFNREELRKIDAQLLRFLNSKESLPSITVIRGNEEVEVFKKREVSHLYDVRGIFRRFFWARNAALLLLLAGLSVAIFQKRYKGILYGHISSAGFLFLAIFSGLFLLALLDFDFFFIGFHEIFFASGTWIFGPDEVLPQLFPETFWLESALALAAATVAEAVLVIVFFRRLASLSSKPASGPGT
jgi:integral membrane protein (TIGR01906 family)